MTKDACARSVVGQTSMVANDGRRGNGTCCSDCWAVAGGGDGSVVGGKGDGIASGATVAAKGGGSMAGEPCQRRAIADDEVSIGFGARVISGGSCPSTYCLLVLCCFHPNIPTPTKKND